MLTVILCMVSRIASPPQYSDAVHEAASSNRGNPAKRQRQEVLKPYSVIFAVFYDSRACEIVLTEGGGQVQTVEFCHCQQASEGYPVKELAIHHFGPQVIATTTSRVHCYITYVRIGGLDYGQRLSFCLSAMVARFVSSHSCKLPIAVLSSYRNADVMYAWCMPGAPRQSSDVVQRTIAR